jgi:hypothetical protein
MVMALVPVSVPPVLRTIEVFVEVAAKIESAVKDGTVLVMEVTDPKK